MHSKELPAIYFFFNSSDTKSMAAAPADFTVISYIKLKLPTIIRDSYIRVKIFNRRPKLKLISTWRTLEHEKENWP